MLKNLAKARRAKRRKNNMAVHNSQTLKNAKEMAASFRRKGFKSSVFKKGRVMELVLQESRITKKFRKKENKKHTL